ncbi:hypothetical protein LTR53_006673 [Teratosphaeriaceae sp. CCFEE 6253]|nr:hypothetical protein LTR53_006673 [Teratosphaeriaceae sp. CCFEE 6253]
MAPILKKRRLNTQQPAELTFDPTARNEYLTGFHKRKVARKENARETAIKRDKEEKVAQRKQLREQRKTDLQRHMEEFNAELRKQNPDLSDAEADAKAAGEDGVVDEAAPEQEDVVREDAEYVDEDKYTTVTVEAMGASDEGITDNAASRTPKQSTDPANPKAVKKRPWDKGKSADGKAKAKKQKFRYETKSERQDTRRKQKNKSQAAKAKREKGSS